MGSHRGAWARRLILGTGLLAAAVLLLWGALVASFHLVPLPERLAAPGSPVVTWADGSTAHVSLAPDDRWRIPADLERVDPQYVQALLRLEDKRFHHHPGVDPLAIVRAAGLNLMRGRVVSGGSTLTMQLVRLVEPRPRTLVSKGIEAWRALQLEHFHTKDEILAAYLTFTPYGRNVEGLEAAALACFGHDARALSAAEVATLLAIPQAPSQRHPAPANAAALKAGRDKVAAFLAEQGVLPIGPGGQGSPEQVLAQVRATTVPPGLAAFPRDIPEVASWLRQRHPERTRIATTLERGTQRAVGIHLRRRHAALAHRGIHGGAAVVVETDTGRVVALVGSLDPWGDGEGDRIAMFDVARSPGSALKPFLYARAIDRGLALPEHLVRDVPVSFRGYAPRNYGGRYEGLVRLEDSLSRSLNLPFVFLLQEIGVEDALHTLRRGGVHSLVDAEGHYGLSLAAGGVEVTPLELTALYAALAADGQARPIRVTAPEAGPAPATPLFRPGAAWLTRRALRLRDRPDFPGRRELAAVPVGIHWKTGTSFGHRDAWACGSGPDHTACVWLGNPDMTPSKHLVGSEAAGPILFDVLEAVGPRSAVAWTDPRPSDLVQIEVDAFSGRLPTDATPHTRPAWALRDAVPPARDPFHVRRQIEEATGLAVHDACRDGRAVREETFLVFPAAVRRWLADQHRRLPAPPAWAEGCAPPGRQAAPSILSPVAGDTVVLVPGLAPDRQEIPLEADTVLAGELSWFVDGVWLGTRPADERLWWTPTPGRHTATVRDAAGRTTTVAFVVEDGARVARSTSSPRFRRRPASP